MSWQQGGPLRLLRRPSSRPAQWQVEQLVTVQQLVDAILKTVDPASHFALQGQVTPTGHQRLPHSLKAALWWLLPSDGEFQRAPNGTHYYLARQGRRVVLRGGDVTQTLFGSRMNWIYDPAPPAPLCILVLRPCILMILLCLLAIPRHPPLPLAHHQELLSSHLSPENADKGGGEGLAAQSIGIQ